MCYHILHLELAIYEDEEIGGTRGENEMDKKMRDGDNLPVIDLEHEALMVNKMISIHCNILLREVCHLCYVTYGLCRSIIKKRSEKREWGG